MILVLTAGFGDGHNTAAFSTAEALRRLHPKEEVQVCDLITETHPRLATLLKALYQQAITHFPGVWRLVYRWLERSNLDPQDHVCLAPLVGALQRKLSALQPRLIVSTYPLYASLLAVLRRQGVVVPPLLTVITDSISIHRIWVQQPSDCYAVADEETRAVVTALGVEPEKIQVTGFPVSLRFIDPLAESAHAQRILYLPSTPARRVAATLKALRPLLAKGIGLTVLAGKHEARLYQVLRRFTDLNPDAPVEIIGWTDRMPEWLRSHDVVICKAGGAILHEVLAARVPVVIDYVVPGQEEGNAELLRSRQCALCTSSAAETATAVAQVLADNGRLGREMRTRMQSISVPDAALRTAQAAWALT